MDRFNDINLGWAFVALVAAGAVGGGISAGISLIRERRAGKRT